MPASQVMKKFHKGKLHSGSKHGPVVTKLKQAKAIQLSELRDEGYDIPKKPPAKSVRNRRLARAKI